jgi:AraC-like DNA-binding protein
MEYLDLGLRGASISLLAVLCVLMLQSHIGLEARFSILAVGVTKSAFLLTTSAVTLPFPQLVESNLILLTSLTPNALTWLIVTIFIDPPGRRWPWLVASSVASFAFFLHFIYPAYSTICAMIALPLYGSLLVLSIWSARDDLVECRCRARPAFAVAIAGLALLFTSLQAFDAPALPALALMKSATTLAVTFAFTVWILRPDLSLWPGPQEPELSRSPVRNPSTTQADAKLIACVKDAMDAGIWREEGLTIGALSARLSVPEHRLRRAINDGLGHRNFSSFINAARIEAACQALNDPKEAGTTVLEIAYRVGFASLGPFNRAFRAETGMSPTEYRRQAEQQLSDSENVSPIPANLH